MLTRNSPGLNTGLNSKYYSIGDAVTMECCLGVGSDGDVPSETAWYVTMVADTGLDFSLDMKITCPYDEVNKSSVKFLC